MRPTKTYLAKNRNRNRKRERERKRARKSEKEGILEKERYPEKKMKS